jgi:hypothetical protein
LKLEFNSIKKSVIIALLALISTIFNYQFGYFDHQEHLPLLFRLKSDDYLILDHFLNSNSAGYDPRLYSSSLIILLTKFIPLPFVFFMLCLGCNWIIGWASYKIGKLCFSGSNSAGLLATIFVLSVRTVELGSTAEVHYDYFTPNALGFALSLLALSQILVQRWMLAGFILGLASLIHPLVGPETGLLYFGISFLLLIPKHRFKIKAYLPLFAGGLLFMSIACIHLLPYFLADGDKLDDKTFFEIYAYFRAPHHVIPSKFLIHDEPKLGIYLFSLGIALFSIWWVIQPKLRRLQYFFLLLWAALLGLVVIGYIFVEIYPIRLVVTAQTFRLLYLFKWSVLFLLAGTIADLWTKGTARQKFYALAMLFCSMSFWPLLQIFILLALTSSAHRHLKTAQWLIFFEIAILIYLSYCGLAESWFSLEKRADAYLWATFLILIPLSHQLPKAKVWQPYLLASTALGLILYWSQHPRTEDMPIWQKAISRQYSLNDMQGPLAEVARKAKALTPKDALLITAPSSSEVRYLAERAIVVDFKTFPFKGQAMKDWRQRLLDVYGWTEKKGFDAVQWAYMPHYRVIKTEKLLEIQQKYGATHAILYKETETDFPVLFENEAYKLIYLDKHVGR